MWYMWHGGIVAWRAQGIAPTMLRSHPQTCSSIVFPLPKVGIRGGEVCGHGGGKRRHYYTRYARHACIVVAALASAMPTCCLSEGSRSPCCESYANLPNVCI